jgi:hypothetical protein
MKELVVESPGCEQEGEKKEQEKEFEERLSFGEVHNYKLNRIGILSSFHNPIKEPKNIYCNSKND